MSSYTKDALPNMGRASFLRSNINGKLKESLRHLIDVAEDVIPQETFSLCHDKVSRIDACAKVSPLYHMINSKLVESVEREDIDGVIAATSNLKAIQDGEYGSVRIQSLEDLSPYFRSIFLDIASFDLSTKPILAETERFLFEENKSVFDQACECLSKYAPDAYKEAIEFISSVLFIKGEHIKAGSSFNAFGLIYIEQRFAPTLEEMIDLIVHESSHLYLYSLSMEDILVENDLSERYEAPLRKDKRPLIGIYHAVFVVSRIIYVFNKLLNTPSLTPSQKTKISAMIDSYKSRYMHGVALLKEHAKLTQLGRDLLESTADLIS